MATLRCQCRESRYSDYAAGRLLNLLTAQLPTALGRRKMR